jgi:hypothetical protein
MRDSSMNRVSTKSTDPMRASTLLVARGKESCNRQEIAGGRAIERDSEYRIIISPPGRTEEHGVQSLFQPGDVTQAGKDPARGKSKRDPNRRTGG